MPIELAERSSHSVGRSTILPETRSILAASLRTIAVWFLRSAQRRALRDLAQEPRLLRDIGLTPDQVLPEANKPFWRR